MKPSEINARLAELNALSEPLRAEIKGLRDEAKAAVPADEGGKANPRLAEIDTAVAKARGQLRPHEAEAETLRAAKAEIINAYGVKIRQIRASGKLQPQAFVEWRNGLFLVPEDDRLTAIDAKLRECGL